MAPNLSGDHFSDYTSACNMLDCILSTYINMIAKEGVFIYKIFEGPRTNGIGYSFNYRIYEKVNADI